MSPDLLVPFGLSMVAIGVLIGVWAERRDRQLTIGIWCPYCYGQTRLCRARTWRKVIVCQNCDRAIGHEDMFER